MKINLVKSLPVLIILVIIPILFISQTPMMFAIMPEGGGGGGTTRPPMPTGVDIIKLEDLAYNTPEVYLAWNVNSDSYPDSVYIRVYDYDVIIEYIFPTQEEISQKYLIYSVPDEYVGYPLTYELHIRNYNSRTNSYSYSAIDREVLVSYDINYYTPCGYKFQSQTSFRRYDSHDPAYLGLSYKVIAQSNGHYALMISAYFSGNYNYRLSYGLNVKVSIRNSLRQTLIIDQTSSTPSMHAKDINGYDLPTAISTSPTADILGNFFSAALTVCGVTSLVCPNPFTPIASGVLLAARGVNSMLKWFPTCPTVPYRYGTYGYVKTEYRTTSSTFSKLPVEMCVAMNTDITPYYANQVDVLISVSLSSLRSNTGTYWPDSGMYTSLGFYH